MKYKDIKENGEIRALIIADKTDVRRSRVRQKTKASFDVQKSIGTLGSYI